MLSSDPANCGRCGNACPTGQTCSKGVCTSSCPVDQTVCGNRCVDLNSDPANCHSCGNVCLAGTGCCSGACIQLINNDSDCGGCGIACPPDKFCYGTTCACRHGVDCGGVCTDTSSDPKNCGACKHVCTGGTCSNGTCVCPPGTTNCSDTCSRLSADPNNCGTCGNKCPSGMVCNFGFCESVSESSNTVCDPNTNLCSTTKCTNFDGECTGLNGPRKCVTAPGVPLQCCDSNIFFGEHLWVHICTRCNSDRFGRCLTSPVTLTPSQGCGVCY